MSQYAQMYFAEKEEDIPINRYLLKLPPAFRDRILKWKLAMKYEEITVWGVPGERIQMPMTYTMYRKMHLPIRRSIFKKMESKLLQRGITHVLLPKVLKTSPFFNIQDCKGDHVKPFFIMEAIRFISNQKKTSKDLKDLEIIILDGNIKDVNMIVDFIYPHVNYLTIITENPEDFTEKVENIFDDVGLNVRIASYNKATISQGDIIIDTHYDDPGIIHYCKKHALYIDMGNHIEKTIMLLEKQNTVHVIDEFLLIQNEEVLSIDQAELILVMKGMFRQDYNETMKILKKENITIRNLANKLECKYPS